MKFKWIDYVTLGWFVLGSVLIFTMPEKFVMWIGIVCLIGIIFLIEIKRKIRKK